LNGVLVETFSANWNIAGVPFGKAFVVLTLASEGALLFVAAQTGFIDGPRSWPTWRWIRGCPGGSPRSLIV